MRACFQEALTVRNMKKAGLEKVQEQDEFQIKDM